MQHQQRQKLKIRVVGVGGAGVKIAGALVSANCEYADLAAVDTDDFTISNCPLENAVCIGKSIADGNGSGGDAAVAKEAAISDIDILKRIASDSEIFICIAGLGGGTGSVVAPILAKLAAENGAKIVLSFSIMPLNIEGCDKSSLAERSVRYLRKVCDAAVALPNDVILARSKLPIQAAFEAANMHIVSAVMEICTMLSKCGIVNIDLPSFKKVFFSKGTNTFFGIGNGSGANAVENAISELASSPLLGGENIKIKAESLMISLVCGDTFEMNKMQALLESAAKTFDVKERICFGAIIDKSFGNKIKVCAMGLSGQIRGIGEQTTPTANLENRVESVQNVAHSTTAAQPLKEVAQPQYTAANTSDSAQVEARYEEPKQKKPRGFFGFGRSKQKIQTVSVPEEQSEFKFVEMSEQRGFFEDTPVNIRKGEDLDVPTFLRRNIKINL